MTVLRVVLVVLVVLVVRVLRGVRIVLRFGMNRELIADRSVGGR
jgi:hypothetical protein